jgi:hypothetical protein
LQKELNGMPRSPWRKKVAVEGPQLDFQLLFQSAPSLFVVVEAAPGYTVLAASDAYLRATRTGVLFVGALYPIVRRTIAADRDGFPVERAWADARPESFHLRYASAAARIYSVELRR